MYSLFFVGSYIENRYGNIKYLTVLFISIIIGTLTHSILSENNLLLGLSGGLYALIVIYFIDMLKSRIINLTQILPLILANILINFTANVSYLAHLGGLLTGYIFYLIFNKENRTGYIILIIIMLVTLSIKYISIDTIEPLYAGSDRQVIEVIQDLGYDKYASRLNNELYKVYNRYGR